MPDCPERQGAKTDRHFTRGAALDNIEALVVAIILALVLRCFLVEAFAIPTGSMGPTLLGDHYQVGCTQCGYRFAVDKNSPPFSDRDLCPNCGAIANGDPHRLWGGDRILVNKTLYRFQKPNRWDPFVFINPTLSSKETEPKSTFIKRLVGLPSETLEIIRGDVIVNGCIQRKTPTAQRSLWMLVYDSHWPWSTKPTWEPDATPAFWKQENGLLTVDARQSNRLTFVRFKGHEGDYVIKDQYGYNAGAGSNVVTDLRVSLDVTPHGQGSVVLALSEDSGEVSCVIPVAGTQGSRARVTIGKEAPEEFDADLPLDKTTRVEFSRLDYRISLKVAGKEVFAKDLWSESLYTSLVRMGREGKLTPHQTSGVRIGADHLQADFSWIRIDRDVYYGSGYYLPGITYGNSEIEHYWGIPGGPFGPTTRDKPDYIGPIRLGPDQYLALGDNSPKSSDSRYWGPVPGKNLIGKALVVWWYPTRLRFIH